ncbi:hypothetical protein WAI453_013624 [Rhynchosporium graminicola]
MVADSQRFSDEIDLLLGRYLQLLDEYTSLLVTLSTLQSSIYSDIARANFQAERGVSYGRESYDWRAMRVGRLCQVNGDVEEGTAVFEVEKVAASGKAGSKTPGKKAEGDKGNILSETEDIEEALKNVTVQADEVSEAQGPEEDQEEKDKTSSRKSTSSKADDTPTPSPPQTNQIPDPLRLFGFSIPSALRTAQSSSMQMVETSIPRLATVTLQMRALEIQIRRARKYRTKALAVEGGNGDAERSLEKEVAV